MFRKMIITTAAFATIIGAGIATNTTQAEARVSVHIGLGGGYYGGGYYGGGYYGGGHGYYRPVRYRRCFRSKRRVRVWSNAHGHWHTRWRRGRLICRY